MSGSEGTAGLGGSAGRRRLSLAHLEPIFDLHLYRARNPSEIHWDRYDCIALVQLTVDTVALSSGLDGNLGVPRKIVLEEMERVAGLMAPDRPTTEHAHVAGRVLDHLLRHDEPTPYFTITYADPGNGWKPTPRAVRILFETLASDGSSLHVNVDNTAVTLLLIATNRSLEDEHEAVIAVMRAQAESGRLDAAIDSAEDALTLSRTYAANVRRMILEAERDVTRVDYLNVLRPELVAANAHLDRRISVDGTLLRHLENLRADASEVQEPAAVRQIAFAVSRLGDAIETLAELLTDVLSATPRWRRAQAAQAFTATPASEIDPTTDVLAALLGDVALPPGAELSPPGSRPILNFVDLANRLIAPPRCPLEPQDPTEAEEVLVDAAGIYLQFPDQFHDVAHVLRLRRIPPGGCSRLSDLLSDADDLFDHPELGWVAELVELSGGHVIARLRLRLLLALDALMLWRPDGPGSLEEWWAADDGLTRDLPDLTVPDLILHRKGGSHGRT